MKKDIASMIINLIVLLFLFSTFFLQYEYLFVTRIVLITFAIMYLIIEIKKGYFSANKRLLVLVSVVSIVALVVSIFFDHSSASGVNNDRDFFIPFYVFVLNVIMYKDLYTKQEDL